MRIALSGSQRRFERSLPFLRVVKSQFYVCTSFCEISGALPYFNSSLAALAALQAAFIFAVCFAIPALKIDSEPFSTVY